MPTAASVSRRRAGLGYAEGVPHDYKRHRTTTLFAALGVLNGTVLADCKSRHRDRGSLAFLRRIEQAAPENLDIHLIVDNYSTHKHALRPGWSSGLAGSRISFPVIALC